MDAATQATVGAGDNVSLPTGIGIRASRLIDQITATLRLISQLFSSEFKRGNDQSACLKIVAKGTIQ
jgi:hypothetical protein